ncbi:NAD(P)-dependent dehydrogenase (short-subunit alcohol dehydrogenase family) [Williamsia sp. R60]
MTKLTNKVAFITGVARGQGRAHAVRMAREGAEIVGVDLAGPLPGVPYDSATPADLAETAPSSKLKPARRCYGKVTYATSTGLSRSPTTRWPDSVAST